MLRPFAILSVTLGVLAPAAGAAPAPPSVCGLYEAIEPDDTIATIAARCQIEEDLLLLANPDIGSDLDLRIGESLMIGPTGTAAAEQAQAEQTQAATASATVPTPIPEGTAASTTAVQAGADGSVSPEAAPPPAPLPQIGVEPATATAPQTAPATTTASRTTTVTTTPTPATTTSTPTSTPTEQDQISQLAPGQGDVIISAPSEPLQEAPVTPAAPNAAETAQTPEPAATAQTPAPPSAPVAPEAYSRDVVGLWQEVGGSCGNVETSWAFTATELRSNGLICEIDSINAEGAALRLDVRCAGEAQTRSYVVAPRAGAGMTVTGSQFQTNLKACPG